MRFEVWTFRSFPLKFSVCWTLVWKPSLYCYAYQFLFLKLFLDFPRVPSPVCPGWPAGQWCRHEESFIFAPSASSKGKQSETAAPNTSEKESIRFCLAGVVWCSEDNHIGPWHLKTASPCSGSAGRSWWGEKGKWKWMRMDTCGCDAGFGCISEKHTICSCHWMDNPEICGIKVNLSLKMKQIQNLSSHNFPQSARLLFC